MQGEVARHAEAEAVGADEAPGEVDVLAGVQVGGADDVIDGCLYLTQLGRAPCGGEERSRKGSCAHPSSQLGHEPQNQQARDEDDHLEAGGER